MPVVLTTVRVGGDYSTQHILDFCIELLIVQMGPPSRHDLFGNPPVKSVIEISLFLRRSFPAPEIGPSLTSSWGIVFRSTQEGLTKWPGVPFQKGFMNLFGEQVCSFTKPDVRLALVEGYLLS